MYLDALFLAVHGMTELTTHEQFSVCEALECADDAEGLDEIMADAWATDQERHELQIRDVA